MTFDSDIAEQPGLVRGAGGETTSESVPPSQTRPIESPLNGDAHREDTRAVLAQVLYEALRGGASTSQLKECFREALFDAVRRIRNEDGLTVNQAAREYGVRRNDLASTDVDDQLDVAILNVAKRVVSIIQTRGATTPEGFVMTLEQVHSELDDDGDGLWKTLTRTYPRDAFRYVIDRVLKSHGAWEPSAGSIAVKEKSFFSAIKLSESIPLAHFSVGEYLSVIKGVVAEMKSVAYRAGLRRNESPRTRQAAYASLTFCWDGDACSFVDSVRESAQGASQSGQLLTVVVGARQA